MQETWVQSLGWKDPLEEGMATHSSVLAWIIPMDRGAWWDVVRRVAKSWTRLKQLSTHASLRLMATLNSLSAGSFCLHLDTA